MCSCLRVLSTMLVSLSLVLSCSVLAVSGEGLVLSPLAQTNATPRQLKRGPPTCPEPKSNCEDFDYDFHALQCIGDEIFLTPCYCLSDENNSFVTHCQFTCFRTKFLTASNKSALLEKQCSHFNRTGKFCRDCINGTAPPAFSFSLKCIVCKSSWKNIVEYVAVAYIPLFVFVALLIAFRISVNSAPLLGYILVAQTCTFPFQVRLAVGMIEAGHTETYQTVGLHILISNYAIWNLDFFRTVIPSFCLGPHWKFAEIACLDYIIAAYPCVLILLTYATIELYSRGYRLVCWWRPFHWFLSRLKNEMNIKIPLVGAFGTFFSLSYAKTLNTTFDILAIAQTWNKSGTVTGYVSYYYAGRPKPLFITIGITMFIIFNLFPIALLFFFSFKPTPNPDDPTEGFFRPLINCLLAPYKDGRNGTRNCRWFSVVYLLVRILIVAGFLCSPNIFFQLLAVIIFLCLGVLVVVVKPYKSDTYNTVDTVFVFSLSICYMSVLSFYYSHFFSPASVDVAVWFMQITCTVPTICLLGLIGHCVVFTRRYPQRLFRKVSKFVSAMKEFCQRQMKRRVTWSPLHESDHASVSSRRTMYVTIESGTVRVSNVDLSQ